MQKSRSTDDSFEMADFDEDGIQALSELLGDNAQEFVDRLKALQTLSREYTSFAGASGNEAGSVQFILRTESIGE